MVEERIKSEIRHGQLNEALRDAASACREYGTKSEKWAWHFRVLKAQVLVSQSAYKDALGVLSEDLPSELHSTDIAAQRKVFQGIAHRYGQQYDAAQRDFEEAEQIARTLDPKYLGQVLIAKGALQVDRIDYRGAEATYKKALSIAQHEKLHDLQASTLCDLGRVATSQDHFDEAVDRNQAAIKLARSLKLGGLETTILGNMGWNYYELGDFESALDYYRQGAEASEQSALYGNTAYWFSGVANSYVALHDYSAAEALARRTLERARQLDNAQTITECLNTLAELMLKTGRPAEAEAYVREALAWEEKGKDHFGTLQSTLLSGRIEAGKRHFARSERVFRQLLKDKEIPVAVKWEAHARLAKLHDDQGSLQTAEKEYDYAIKTVEAAQDSIDSDELRISFLAGAIEFYEDYVDFLVRRGSGEGALNVAEESRARTLARGLASKEGDPDSSTKLRPEEIAQRLNATLLFYWIGHNQSYLWVINPAKTTFFKLPKASEIEPLVKSYSKALPHLSDAQDAGAADGRKLYAMLVEPAKKLIAPRSRVILLPAEDLYGLSFDTLVVPDPKPHFWIEDVTLTTASSLTLLEASLRRPTTAGRDLLLVGNAVPTPGFPRLSQATTEIQNVERYFPEVNRRVLEGKQATATAYLNSSPGQYAYLHFVTHGTASRTRPLESAVILSPEGDSYKLYARDVVTHHLNAELVTISACNTSGNRAISGEGLVGLSWAFLRAGAHNVIGALWEVSDVSTPQLMDSLYGGLKQGKDPATALRDAKLSLLHTHDPNSVFRTPFYWAPFQLYAGS